MKSDHTILRHNLDRSGCVDVFHSYLVSNCIYEGFLEIPVIYSTQKTPTKIVNFSSCFKNKDKNCFVHFYEDDFLFERLWKTPRKYIKSLSQYEGLILPDFSVYTDMPLCMQYWNIFRSRALGSWFQSMGLNVIPNIRFGDSRTVNISCLGVPKHSIISIGTIGTIKDKTQQKIFTDCLERVLEILEPKVLIVVGQIKQILPIIRKHQCIIKWFPYSIDHSAVIAGEVL